MAKAVAKPSRRKKAAAVKRKAARKASPVLGSTAQERDWRAQDDLRTLKQAEDIKRDKARLAAVRKQLLKEEQALKAIKARTNGKAKR